MTMEIIMICQAALFFAKLNLAACFITNFLQTADSQPSQQNILPVLGDVELESDSLPPEIFPTKITDFLSPEMFSQPDPVRYFLGKSIKLWNQDVSLVQGKLHIILTYQRDQVPSRYLPYAEVLENLLRFQYHLHGVKAAICEIQHSAVSTHPQLPADLFSPELFELLSDDILSDDRPPLRLIFKLINTPTLKDKIHDFRNELKKAVGKRKVHVIYKRYLLELRDFFTKEYIVQLQAKIVKWRDISNKI